MRRAGRVRGTCLSAATYGRLMNRTSVTAPDRATRILASPHSDHGTFLYKPQLYGVTHATILLLTIASGMYPSL